MMHVELAMYEALMRDEVTQDERAKSLSAGRQYHQIIQFTGNLMKKGMAVCLPSL
jgi:hypothetical protein